MFGLLLALPQMYGVGYPVMFKATAGGYALWFLIVLAFGKILAASLAMGVGGSGGIFAPSLFRSRALSYGTIYSTRLLRRGIDIDRASPGLTTADRPECESPDRRPGLPAARAARPD